MQNVLADLALKSEAATAFALRLARCFDMPDASVQARLARVLTPAGKYWLCKRDPGFCGEAMAVMGGNGYVEDGPLARLFREVPVNSIWEGSGNVMCLDLRAFGKAFVAREALAGEANADFNAHAQSLLAESGGRAGQGCEYGARRLAKRTVLWFRRRCCCAMRRRMWPMPFMRSRMAARLGGAYGCLPAGVDCAAILARAGRRNRRAKRFGDLIGKLRTRVAMAGIMLAHATIFH